MIVCLLFDCERFAGLPCVFETMQIVILVRPPDHVAAVFGVTRRFARPGQPRAALRCWTRLTSDITPLASIFHATHEVAFDLGGRSCGVSFGS